MNIRKVIIIGTLSILFICTGFALGYLKGTMQKEKTWCLNYMGTDNLHDCRTMAKEPRPI